MKRKKYMATKYDIKIREEELKNKVAIDYFNSYDHTHILGNVDFAISRPEIGNSLFEVERHYFYWAECKRGNNRDIIHSITQLILTIGKARTFDKETPPKFLGAFDAEKIAFVPYNLFLEILYKNDFNWNVTPSNPSTPQFAEVFDQLKSLLNKELLIYNFEADHEELKAFIKQNFIYGQEVLGKRMIDRNNFISVYQKWSEEVMPYIAIDWEKAKSNGIIAADFYLADLLSGEEEFTIRQGLFVLLRNKRYELNRKINDFGLFTSSLVDFKTDGIKHHKHFWSRYHRPPRKEYWDYMVQRRDLLVPQDVRERKGAFFTPRRWVELSQKYLADVLGEAWQEHYVIWDCAAGTGNLLAGLTERFNIFASTLDKADVDVMHDRINNGANLVKEHVFQFDFLNDEMNEKTLPKALWEIVSDEEKRKKLVIYINPPYAEATSGRTVTGTGTNRSGVTTQHRIHSKYKSQIGAATNEVYALFLARIYDELKGVKIGEFSTVKALQGSNFKVFRDFFRAKLEKMFIVPANTFDNVKGEFPIGFKIWDTQEEQVFSSAGADVYDASGLRLGTKMFYGQLRQSIQEWRKTFIGKGGEKIGLIVGATADYQNNIKLAILSKPQARYCLDITVNNIIEFAIYFAVRLAEEASWLNDRDQFLYPNDGWRDDLEFQSDCLAFTLFHGQNRITSTEGINHWIPFSEEEVGARQRFSSHFMHDFIKGKRTETKKSLFDKTDNQPNTSITFSEEASDVMNNGRELWRYYHSQVDSNPNASYYDIRAHFQGFSKRGRMNNKSDDDTYNQLIHKLKKSLERLANKKIIEKAYDYSFLIK